MLVIPQRFGGLVIPRSRGSAEFEGGNQAHGSVLEFARYMGAKLSDGTPAAGGTLTINSQSLGSYDYVIKAGNQTISSFTNSDWFTATGDSRSAWIAVQGNLTINSGQALQPANRKLFTVVYVTGDLIVNGSISMSQRGANHSATGSNISAAAIRIATGTFSGVSNPQVPAAGAATQTGQTVSGGTDVSGTKGNSGTDGQTGSGGTGAVNTSSGNTGKGGDGAAGTSFSGGSGGGASRDTVSIAADGSADGGAGGAAQTNDTTDVGGGAGNPGGVGGGGTGQAGSDGTGGVLIVICEGQISGSGSITADGARGGDVLSGTRTTGGGGSGGGSITVLYGTDSSSITPSAAGGAGGTGSQGTGGAGGDGTARKLALAA